MPHDRNLLKYVWQSKREGISDAEIRKSLEERGLKREDIERIFEALGGMARRFLHLHIFHRHVPLGVAILVLLFTIGSVALTSFLYLKETIRITEVVILNGETGKIEFTYGSWPALENAKFFETVKQRFITENADFIEADISAMVLRVYKKGALVKEAPIITKGREGSWWETPVGLYKVEAKEKSHYSSFGHVYMPWSMQFQGNFFIHGRTYYPDGTLTSNTYSGGCMRLSTEDAEAVFRIAEVGMPVLVFEKSFGSEAGSAFKYAVKKPTLGAVSYVAADLENNFVFAEDAPKEQRSIASLTKLMTALIAVEYINVEREVEITSSMVATTSIQRLHAGDRRTVLDLLSLLLMESSNEAALAVIAPLGRSRFVNLMNKKAEAIGMKESHFVDTSGVQSGDVSTAENLYLLAKYLYYNRRFVLHMSVGNENRVAYGLSQFRHLTNLNELPGLAKMVGGKVGLSTAAGESMLAVFETEIGGQKRPIVIIVLVSDDSKRDINTLMQYIQSSYAAVQGGAETMSVNQ